MHTYIKMSHVLPELPQSTLLSQSNEFMERLQFKQMESTSVIEVIILPTSPPDMVIPEMTIGRPLQQQLGIIYSEPSKVQNKNQSCNFVH